MGAAKNKEIEERTKEAEKELKAIRMDTLKINSNHRVFICGMTGTGKTELAKQIFENCERGIIYDIEWAENLEGLGEVIHSAQEIDFSKHQKFVLQPLTDDVEEFDAFCELLFYEHSNMMLYVDEVSDLASRHFISKHFSLIIRRGRKAGIGTLMATQRTADVNKVCISQAEHVMAFYVHDPAQIAYLGECTGSPKRFVTGMDELKKEEYSFLYYDKREVHIMSPITITPIMINKKK